MRDRARLAQAAELAAGDLRDVIALLRQAFDVRLVDKGVLPGDRRPLLMRPAMGRIDHHGFVHIAGVVAPVEGEVRLLGAHDSIEALYEARRLLEGANVRLAAERATAVDLDILTDCLRRMTEGASAIERWSEADLDFHRAIANATHNPFLAVLLEPFVDQLRGVIAEGYLVPGAVERGLQAHIELLNFIKARDADGAR